MRRPRAACSPTEFASQLYLAYAKSLGIDKAEMYATDYCAGALLFKTYMSDICSRFLEGVSAHMLAGEAQIPGLYGKIANKLKEKSISRTKAFNTGSCTIRPMRTIRAQAGSCSTNSPRPRRTGNSFSGPSAT